MPICSPAPSPPTEKASAKETPKTCPVSIWKRPSSSSRPGRTRQCVCVCSLGVCGCACVCLCVVECACVFACVCVCVDPRSDSVLFISRRTCYCCVLFCVAVCCSVLLCAVCCVCCHVLLSAPENPQSPISAATWRRKKFTFRDTSCFSASSSVCVLCVC